MHLWVTSKIATMNLNKIQKIDLISRFNFKIKLASLSYHWFIFKTIDGLLIYYFKKICVVL